MKIPKHLGQPGMTAERKKFVVAHVKECRKALSKAPAFDTTQAAIDRAVEMVKSEEYSFPSVWKEPQDVGKKHAVVRGDLREKAYNAGYTEEITERRIGRLALGLQDDDEEIEEVD